MAVGLETPEIVTHTAEKPYFYATPDVLPGSCIQFSTYLLGQTLGKGMAVKVYEELQVEEDKLVSTGDVVKLCQFPLLQTDIDLLLDRFPRIFKRQPDKAELVIDLTQFSADEIAGLQQLLKPEAGLVKAANSSAPHIQVWERQMVLRQILGDAIVASMPSPGLNHAARTSLSWDELERIYRYVRVEPKLSFQHSLEKIASAKLYQDMQKQANPLVSLGHVLQALNDASVIIRDLKPQHLFPYGLAQVIDFGLAQIGDEMLEDSPVGTPAFVAPEVLQQQYSIASDSYAFIKSLFYALTKQSTRQIEPTTIGDITKYPAIDLGVNQSGEKLTIANTLPEQIKLAIENNLECEANDLDNCYGQVVAVFEQFMQFALHNNPAWRINNFPLAAQLFSDLLNPDEKIRALATKMFEVYQELVLHGATNSAYPISQLRDLAVTHGEQVKRVARQLFPTSNGLIEPIENIINLLTKTATACKLS